MVLAVHGGGDQINAGIGTVAEAVFLAVLLDPGAIEAHPVVKLPVLGFIAEIVNHQVFKGGALVADGGTVKPHLLQQLA